MGEKQVILEILVLSIFLAGCGSSGREISVQKETYTKLEYPQVKVQVGDLSPKLTLNLRGEGKKQRHYKAAASDLEIKKIHVKVGDKVKKGDLLLSFHSDEIAGQLSSYKKQIREDALLIEHYEKLMRADSSQDYREDIAELKKEQHVARLYVKEAKKRNRYYQIRAREDGVITMINKELVVAGYRSDTKKVLLREETGKEKFTVKTADSYDFEKGKIYRAEDEKGEKVSLRLMESKEQKSGRTLTFRAVSDVSRGQKSTLTLVLKKRELSDVVYVDSKAVSHIGDRNFVYVVDEQGYQNAVEVVTGEEVDGCTVILSGLKGGENVTCL